MSKTPVIRLRHTFFEGDQTFYFYEGQTPVVGGVIEVPVDRPEWAQRAYIKGYRLNVKSRQPRTLDDIFAEMQHKLTKSAKSAEEKTNAGPDGRGQSTADNRVRKGAAARAGELPVEGMGSGGGDGAAEARAGD